MKFTVAEMLAATGGRLLAGRRDGPAGSVSTDTRMLGRGETFLAIRGERFDGHDFLDAAVRAGAARLIVDREDCAQAFAAGDGEHGRARPAVAHPAAGDGEHGRARPAVAHPAAGPDVAHTDMAVILVRDTLESLAALGRAARERLACPVIAVTGSCGKTTVKEMLGQILVRRIKGRAPPASFNNQIGVPLTLLAAEPDDGFVLCEFGTSHPGEIAALAAVGRPTIGIVTVVAPVHLEGLGSIEGVAREKAALVESLGADGVAILNADDPRVAAMAGRCRGRVVTVGVRQAADLGGEGLALSERGLRFAAGGVQFEVPVLGEHQALLALAAAAAAREVGVPLAESALALRAFHPPKMRLALEQLGDVTVLNDAYNANPRSMAVALDLLALWPRRRKVFFCGDMRELGAESRAAHEELGRAAVRAGVERLVCVGPESQATAAAAIAAGLPAEAALTLADSPSAAAVAPGMVRGGDVVLVKGSRAMQMERVAEAIAQAHF
jgi:UDP-N-acetylmuramoyl-tripeptide--D-alanyl-D-alanine ligase